MIKEKWSEELIEIYKNSVSNVFILSGNIGDNVIGRYSDYHITNLKEELIALAEKEFKIDEAYSFDYADGLYDIYKGTILLKDRNAGWQELCQKAQNNNDDLQKLFIIEYPEYIFPGNYNNQPDSIERLISFQKTIQSNDFISSNNIIILIAESLLDIHSDLLSTSNGVYTINIDLPNYNNRLEFIKGFYYEESEEGSIGDELEAIKRENEAIRKVFDKVDTHQTANLTAGLSLKMIEDILLLSLTSGELTKDMILNRKEALIKKEYGDILELMDTESKSLDDFAGKDNLKTYFQETVIDAINDDFLDVVPKGVLMMGPPGTGKTYFAQCVAGDANMNCIEFKMSKILDKYVGVAEKNLERAFSVFRALSPVMVFIDEMDQALRRGDNDSNSVSSNLFGMFLSELSKSENRGKIVWLGATNYPNRIDEALKRTGRFDKRLVFFAPSKEEREEVLKIHLQKLPIEIDKDLSINNIVNETDGHTQAELEGIIVKALELARRKRSNILKQEHLDLALKYMSSTTRSSDIKEMENAALLDSNDNELLTEEQIERKNNLILEKEKE